MPDAVLQRVRSACAEALMLILPVDCAGCDKPDAVLCDACAAALRPAVVRRELAAPAGAVIVHSGLVFDGVAARVVRALKADARLALASPLAAALAVGTAAAAAEAAASDLVYVTVPTSAAAFRRRGFRVVDELARRAGLRPLRLLRYARATGDQRALGAVERGANVARSMVARDAAGLRVVVLDDVVTTGATLVEAVRALREAGAVVVGAATVAATPRRIGGGATCRDTFETHT